MNEIIIPAPTTSLPYDLNVEAQLAFAQSVGIPCDRETLFAASFYEVIHDDGTILCKSGDILKLNPATAFNLRIKRDRYAKALSRHMKREYAQRQKFIAEGWKSKHKVDQLEKKIKSLKIANTILSTAILIEGVICGILLALFN